MIDDSFTLWGADLTAAVLRRFNGGFAAGFAAVSDSFTEAGGAPIHPRSKVLQTPGGKRRSSPAAGCCRLLSDVAI